MVSFKGVCMWFSNSLWWFIFSSVFLIHPHKYFTYLMKNHDNLHSLHFIYSYIIEVKHLFIFLLDFFFYSFVSICVSKNWFLRPLSPSYKILIIHITRVAVQLTIYCSSDGGLFFQMKYLILYDDFMLNICDGCGSLYSL